MKRVLCVVGGLLFAVSASTSALADSLFNFSFTGPTFSGSGVFDAASVHSGEFQIVGVTGTTDTGNGTLRAITGVITPGGYEFNDNLLFFPAQGGAFFDANGVSFILRNGAEVNLFSANGAYLMRTNGNEVNEVANIAVTPAASPIPEPGTLTLLGTGVLSLAGVVRRKLTA